MGKNILRGFMNRSCNSPLHKSLGSLSRFVAVSAPLRKRVWHHMGKFSERICQLIVGSPCSTSLQSSLSAKGEVAEIRLAASRASRPRSCEGSDGAGGPRHRPNRGTDGGFPVCLCALGAALVAARVENHSVERRSG